MKTTLLLIISLAIMVNLSCSGSKNPVTSPVTPDSGINSGQELAPEPLTGTTPSHNSTRGVWGAWKVHLDTTNLTAELTPAVNSIDRSAMKIGDFYDADLSQFLTVSPCADCLQISGLKIGKNGLIPTLNIDVTMKHPFGNPAKRPDLHGFDVRLIFASDYPRMSFPNMDVMKPDGTIEDADFPFYVLLLNYDGYTSHFDELMADERYFPGGTDIPGNLNPYLRFFDSFSEPAFDPHAPAGHNVMPVGSSNYTRTAKIGLSVVSVFDLYIIADVSYGQSAVLANRQSPQYYLPAFHRTEPWRVEYWIENNTLAYNNPLSTAEVVVQVFDWQQGATVDSGYPNPSNLAGIPESSNVKQVELLIPWLQSVPVVETDPVSGSGSIDDPLVYRLTVKNDNLYNNTFAYGLLAVRDELYGKTAPSGRLPIPQSPAGFPYETLDIRDYTLYTTLFINIPITSNPAIYNNELIVNEKTQYDSGSGTSIDAVHITDISQSKFQYQWDYDYDGITFDTDGEGMPSPVLTFPAPGAYDIGLKVITSSVPPHEYIYTVPVYKAGIENDFSIPSPSPLHETSYTGSQSIVQASDRTFIAYVSNELANREIMLTSIRDDGTLQTKKMSVGTLLGKDNYEPSLAIMGDVGDEELFVAYTARDDGSGEQDIYISKANLEMNLTTTNMAVAKTVNVDEHRPCLVVLNNTLYVYYNRDTLLNYKVYAIKSIDNGSSWTNNTSIDPTGSYERRPTAAYNHYIGNIYCFWEDSRDSLTNGSDIYLAISDGNNGVSFPTIQNVSSFAGVINENSLTAISNSHEVVLSYLAMESGATTNSLWLKIYNGYERWYEDIKIDSALVTVYTKPGIASCYAGYYVVASGKYNLVTQDLNLTAFNLVRTGPSDFEQSIILNQPVGNVSSAAKEIFPALAYRNLAGEKVTEIIMGYTQYNDGILTDTTPFTMNFGTVNILDYYMLGPRFDY
jgi:hypothetical protein